MNNIKIIISIAIIFSITFTLLIFSQEIWKDKTNLREDMIQERIKQEMIEQEMIDFSSSNFSNERTMFLIGSSQIASLNVTAIDNIIKSNRNSQENHISVYNLAILGNTPKQELTRADQIIIANPEKIFYGIAYRDFVFPTENYPKSPLPDIRLIFSEFMFDTNFILENPQLFTRFMIKDILQDGKNESEKNESEKKDIYHVPKTPFVTYEKNPKIMLDHELQKQPSIPSTWNDPIKQYQNFNALDQYIEKIKSGGIDVVIFVVPVNKYYLESLNENQIKSMNNLIHNLEKNHDVKIYNFSERFSELEIWHDLIHVSHHPNVTVYNEAIAEMILKESER